MHPEVLGNFDLPYPTSAAEIDLQAFLQPASAAPASAAPASAAAPASVAAADEDWKKKEAEELKAKQAAEAKKAAEKDALEAANLAKAQALEASGKKVAGGMHKFDASEVDVNGGSATADDFMDAFGF